MVKHLWRALLAFLTLVWGGGSVFLLIAGMINIHPASALLGLALIVVGVLFRRPIMSIWS
ncbi:hypothetical protein [Brevundimonas sp.]|uniref:hypothetical protein n=1 Tax=Brevundimonas sp. TaxID=1871086 RepID=UPI002896F26C|nr:hypothetical protein [Brevundimonas sp.]